MEIFEAKADENLKDLCSGRTEPLEKFVEKVFDLEFDDEPDYEDLRSTLSSLIEST